MISILFSPLNKSLKKYRMRLCISHCPNQQINKSTNLELALLGLNLHIPIVLEQESNQVVIQQDSPPLPLHKTPAFSLEERDTSLLTAEERVQDLYDNQTGSYTIRKKEELPSQDNDLNYGL